LNQLYMQCTFTVVTLLSGVCYWSEFRSLLAGTQAFIIPRFYRYRSTRNWYLPLKSQNQELKLRVC